MRARLCVISKFYHPGARTTPYARHVKPRLSICNNYGSLMFPAEACRDYCAPVFAKLRILPLCSPINEHLLRIPEPGLLVTPHGGQTDAEPLYG